MSKNAVNVNSGANSSPAIPGGSSGWNGNDWYMIFLALPPVIYATGWALDKIGFNVKEILEMDGRIHFRKGDLEFDIDRHNDDSKHEEIIDASAKEVTVESEE
jgi:hypothetical protein